MRPSVTRAWARCASFSCTPCRAASACASASASVARARRVVQSREDLALFDGHAFLDVDLDDFARDLGGHRRPPPRRDIAGRVQHGRLGARRALGHGRCLHLDRLLPRHPLPRADTRAPEHQQHDHPGQPAAAATTALGLALDSKGGEILLSDSAHTGISEGAPGQQPSLTNLRPTGVRQNRPVAAESR